MPHVRPGAQADRGGGVVAGGPRSHAPQDGIAESARLIPGGHLVTIPVGHLVHDAAPEAFTEVVASFLLPEEDVHPHCQPRRK